MRPIHRHSVRLHKLLQQGVLLFALLLGIAVNAQPVILSTTGGGTVNWSSPSTWVGGVVPGSTDEAVVRRNIVVDQASVSIAKLTINTGTTLSFGPGNTTLFEVSGLVTVDGTFTDADAGGINRFSGGIVNNSNTFTSASPVEFFGAAQSIDGAGAVNLNSTVTVVNNILITNNISHANGLYIGANLDGSGIASGMQNNTLIRYNGSDLPFLNGGYLNTSIVGNTFQYMRAGDQNIRQTVYHHLTIAGNGNKNFNDATVNGNFNRTGGTILQASGTLKFSGNTNTGYTNALATAWDDVVIEKTGASLTLNNNLSCSSLTVGLGTLNLGGTARTLTVNGDFAGLGTLDASGANHTIILRGENNSIGSFLTGSSTTAVEYSLLSGTTQTIFGSPNYKTLRLANVLPGTTKVLGGHVGIAGDFRFNGNFTVHLGAFNLSFGNTGTFSSSTTWTNANSANRMFVTEGSGKLLIEKTTIAGFTSVNATNANGYIPIGAGGVHNSFHLTALTGSVTGTGRIEIRVVPTRQPNIPYYNFALQKHWEIETVNISSINANASFYFNNVADVIGSAVNYVPIVYDGSSLVTPAGPSAPGSNPFSTSGTNFLAGEWTAYDPAVRTTLYSYQSGDWADPLTWTTDPSGTTSVFPMVPGAGDAVVILNGRNVYTNATRTVASMLIQDGATLDLRTTTGNNLGPVTGQGTLRLASLSLPTGGSNTNLAQFVLPGTGTIEYYNLGSGKFVLPTSAPYTNTYNNLIISNSSSSTFDLHTNANIVVNGNLTVSRSSSGSTRLRMGDLASDRSLTVAGDFTLGSGCEFSASSLFDGNHWMSIAGNTTISGTAHFTDGAYNDPAAGRIRLVLTGMNSNTSFIANGGSSVRFWDLTMDKAEGHELLINGTPGTIEFRRNPAFRIQNTSGIMRLGSGLSLTLGTTDVANYDIGQANKFPVLWIDGASVVFGGSNSIVPYGTLKITSGSLDVITGSVNKTITLRENGLIKVEGGTVSAACIRISMLDESAHRGGYIQTGGTVNVSGESGPVTYTAVFSLPRPDNVFKMSGGILNVSRQYNGGICPTGGLHIGSSNGNYEVTGGTVNLYSTDNYLFDIATSAPLYDLNVYKVGTGVNGKVRIRSYEWSYNGSPSNIEQTGAFPLHILNNFAVLSTGSPIFDAGDIDVIVNGNMSIASGAEYVSGNNTLHFEGAASQSLSINGTLSFFGTSSNLVSGPEDIQSGVNYGFENITAVQNAPILAPDNTYTSEQILETTDNGMHRFYTQFISTMGPVTASVFVKPSGRNYVSLRLGTFSNQAIAVFDLSTGTVVSTNSEVISANITAEPNGWYRISATSAGASDYRLRLNLQNSPTNYVYSGTASMGVYAWGVMVQNGSTLTPYIPITRTGLNSLSVTKSGSSVLSISGSLNPINLIGTLSLNSGLVNIGGKTIQVAGNVVNNSEIQATLAGRVRLNGDLPQNISGNGSGIFPHLVLAHIGGPSGSVQYTSNANFKIVNSLEMASDYLFSIGNKRITFLPSASLIASSGTFSNNRFIQTGGFLSDAGIEKEYNSSNTSFTFAFGTGTHYTPASISFSSAPTTYGALNVRPVAVKHLYVTDPDALDYYWKVNQTGFTGIAANSVNAVFNYGSLPVSPSITSYVPGYYNYAAIAYTTINNVNEVNELTKNISFNPFSQLEGDYTAGIPAAFGVVVPFYSRSNGNWNNPSTWSNTGHGGAAALGTPAANNPVYIGDGAGFNHAVTVTTNNTFSGSLIVDYGSSLTLGTTTGHNFGALPYSTAGGAGTIRISSSSPVAEFPGGDFGLFFTNDGGTAEYYSGGTSFTLPTSTAPPNALSIQSYKNLRIAATGSDVITLADQDLTILNDLTIAGSSPALATLSNASSKTLQINGNLNVSQGIFEMPNAFAHNIQVKGNLLLGSTGVFRGSSLGSAVHQLNLEGSVVNNGIIQFNTASPVALHMIGTTSASIGGTNASAQLNLGSLYINKGNNQSLSVNINSLGSISAPTNNWLNLINGTLLISRPGNLVLTDQNAVDFTIPSTSALILNNSGLTINAAIAANDSSDFILAGKLELQAGTLNVGNVANNNHNDIEYASTGTPTLIVSGNSTLNVNGQIRRSVKVLLGSLIYNQSGTSTVHVRGRMPLLTSYNLNRAKFEILNEGSSFQMSGNSLLLIDRNGPASNIFGDIYLAPASASVTGGEIRVGTSGTASNTLFEINSNTALWNLTVDGTTTSKTLRLLGNPIQIQKNLQVLGSSIFNANALDVSLGGNLLVENPSASVGLNVGGYQVISANQVTTFNGTTASQSITGNAGNLINFANLTLNNTFPSGALNLASGTNIQVNKNLSLINAGFNTGANQVTVLGNVINNVVHTSGPGGFIVLAGSANQTISGNGSGQFGNLKLNNTAGAEILNATLINGELNLQNGLFYLNNFQLTLGTSATINAGSFDANRMIRLNGVASDAGLRKLFASGSGTFTFPVGVSLKYTPVTISVAANSVPGEITVKPVNTKHPGTTDPANAELTYYWITSGTGFSPGAFYSHAYNYVQTDAVNGDENLYVAGRYFSNQWVPQNGIPSTVNPTSNVITLSGVNYVNGEFTAGEPQEFGDIQVYYSRSNGDFTDPASWSVDQVLKHSGAPALVAPTFNPIVIASAHTITGNTNGLNAPTAEINGTLNLNNTISHNFGVVTGTGKIRMTPTGSNDFIFPGGTYSAFVSSGGGTVEYFSNTAANLPSRTTYNHILFSGTGSKSLFNSDVLVNGDFEIAQGTVLNTYNKQISVKGNFKNFAGIAAFSGGTGLVNMSGLNQQFDGSSRFTNLAINGGGVKTLNASIEITGQLQLNNGILSTGGNLVIIPLGGTVTGASSASYVFGSLQKFLNNATVSKTFEVGDASLFAPVHLNFSSGISGSGSITASTTAGDHPAIASSGINPARSANRYWTVSNSGLGITSYEATFTFNAGDLDGGTNTNLLDVAKRTAGVWTIANTGARSPLSTQAVNLNSFGDFQVGEQLGGGYTWTGSVSQNWHDANNWLPIGVPGATDDVTIPNTANDPDFPTLANGICKNAVVLAGAEINIPAGVSLTVGGNWTGANTLIKGQGTLNFTSPSASLTGTTTVQGIVAVAAGANLTTNNGLILANNASLMHGTGTPGGGGNVSGNVVILRTGFTSHTRYNYWSSPVNNTSVSILGTNKYVFNPVASTASSGQGLLAGWQTASGTMSPAKGYISTGGGTVIFNGNANNGNINSGSLSIGAFTSSNLIGNPYPSAISAASLVAANSNILGGAVYIWDDDNSEGNDYATNDFITWNGIGTVSPNSGLPFNGNIALGQGFFINAANNNPIQFTNSMRTAASSTFFENETISRFWLNVKGAGNAYNETLIGLKQDATEGVDNQYDARKITGSGEIALYSCILDLPYAIQAIPHLNGHTTIQLGLEASTNGELTLSLGRMDEIAPTTTLILEDTRLGIFQNLKNQAEYTFQYDRSSDARRFRLHLYAGVELSAKDEGCDMTGGSILLANEGILDWNVRIRNDEGQLIREINGFNKQMVITGLPAGIYRAELSNSLGTLAHVDAIIQAGTPLHLKAEANKYNAKIQETIDFSALVDEHNAFIEWNMGDGNTLFGLNQFTYAYSQAGIYTVKVRIAWENCTAEESMQVRVEEGVLGIVQTESDEMLVYPNPISGSQVRVSWDESGMRDNAVIGLFDISGKCIQADLRKERLSDGAYLVTLDNVAPGIYQLMVKTSGKSISKRIAKVD